VKEDLAYLLWAMFRIKSKRLCKKGYHFYVMTSNVEKIEQKEKTRDGFKITYKRKWKEPTYVCNVCGKELSKIDYLLYTKGFEVND
jgi:peptide methionine sulfoxide reductase MsrB